MVKRRKMRRPAGTPNPYGPRCRNYPGALVACPATGVVELRWSIPAGPDLEAGPFCLSCADIVTATILKYAPDRRIHRVYV